MPFFLGALLGGLIQACGSLVGRVLVSLGISYVTYSGISGSLDWIKSSIMARLSTAPALLLNNLGVLQVGTCISMLFSTFAAILVLKGMSAAGGSITKMVVK